MPLRGVLAEHGHRRRQPILSASEFSKSVVSDTLSLPEEASYLLQSPVF